MEPSSVAFLDSPNSDAQLSPVPSHGSTAPGPVLSGRGAAAARRQARQLSPEADVSNCNASAVQWQRHASATASRVPARLTDSGYHGRAASFSPHWLSASASSPHWLSASASYTNAGARDFGGDDDGNTGRQPKRTKRMEGTVAAAVASTSPASCESHGRDPPHLSADEAQQTIEIEGIKHMLEEVAMSAQDDRMSTTSMLGNHDGSDDTTGDSRANDAGIACTAAAKTCTAAAKACAAASSARNTAGNACTAPGTASASAGHAAASAAAHDDSQSAHNDAVAGRVTNMEAIVPDSSNHLLILSENGPLMVNKLGRTSQPLCFIASCACVLVCHCQRQLLWSQASVRFQPPAAWTRGGEELQRLKDWSRGLQVLSPGEDADAQCELGGTHGLLYLLDRVARHNRERYAQEGQLVLTLGQGTWRLPLKSYSAGAFRRNMRNGRGAKRRSLERFE